MDQEKNDNPAILGQGDSDLKLGFMSHFRQSSWSSALIEGNARLMALKDSFPKNANPAALVYRGDDGTAAYIYYDAEQPHAQDEALKAIGRNTTHMMIPPLYVRR